MARSQMRRGLLPVGVVRVIRVIRGALPAVFGSDGLDERLVVAVGG
jgi:hypothetical protein